MQKGGTGRDHNPHAMTYWMAGGGAGFITATNEIGNEAVENRVSVNDLHATILHLCGLDHKKSSLTISMAATSDSLTSPEKSLKKSSDSRASIPNGRSEVQRDYLIKDLLFRKLILNRAPQYECHELLGGVITHLAELCRDKQLI